MAVPEDRLWIVGISAAGLLLSAWLGYQIGNGDLFIPLLALACLVCLGFTLIFAPQVRAEVLILAFLIFGYIVGSRGFAGIKPIPGARLYFAEIGMVVCVTFYAMRNAFLKQNPIPAGVLSHTILLFLLSGLVRFAVDFHAYKELAVRDFAAVYYAAFFFLGFSASQHLPSRRFLDNTLLAALLLLIPIYLIYFLAPELLMVLTIQEDPVIFQKEDLMAAFLSWGSFCFFLRGGTSKHSIIYGILSMVMLALMLHGGCRAVYVGTAFGCVLLLAAGQYKWLAVQACAGLLAAIIVLSVVGFNRQYGVYEAVKLSHGGEDSSSDNNQFRIVWWRSVVHETREKSPIFGLGFGYDFAARFLEVYTGKLAPETFDVRSPHNYFITIYGRMGAAGECVWLAIVFLIGKNALESAYNVRRGRQELSDLAPWTGVAVLLGAAMFGVVLEGPMGAVPFWCALGMAMERKSRAEAERLARISAPDLDPLEGGRLEPEMLTV